MGPQWIKRQWQAWRRCSVVDVVPFVPLGDSSMDDALAARDAFATWFAATHGVQPGQQRDVFAG